MWPIDRRKTINDYNTFISIILGPDGYMQTKKLVRFIFNETTKKWKLIHEKVVSGGRYALTEIRNCSLLDNDQIMLVTTEQYMFFNYEFKLLKMSYFKKSALTWAANPNVSCFVPEFSTTKNNGFLIAFLEVDKEVMNVYKPAKTNFNTKYAKLLRCQYNSIREKLEAPNYETETLLVESQYINQVLEFAKNRMLIVLDMTQLLVVHNWRIVHSFEDPSLQGRRGLWMCPMPYFNIDNFPFIVSSGRESINIINVKTFLIEHLIV